MKTNQPNQSDQPTSQTNWTNPTNQTNWTNKTNQTNKTNKTALLFFLSTITLAPATGLAFEFDGAVKGVKITDAAGANQPPNAVINYTKNGNTLTFDASGSNDPDGSIVEYKWDFGDGISQIGKTATYTFPTLGSYPVTLILTDNGGATSLMREEIDTTGGAAFYWSMNELPNVSMSADYGNIIITKHSKDATSSPGVSGNCLQQTGTWQTYKIPMTSLPTTKGSIKLYARHANAAATTDTVNRHFFASSKVGTANSFYAYTYKGFIYFYTYDSAGGMHRVYGPASWEVGKWYSYEFYWNAEKGYLGVFRDGAPLLESTTTSWAPVTPTWDGQDFFIGYTYPLGSFDEFFIYNQ